MRRQKHKIHGHSNENFMFSLVMITSWCCFDVWRVF